MAGPEYERPVDEDAEQVEQEMDVERQANLERYAELAKEREAYRRAYMARTDMPEPAEHFGRVHIDTLDHIRTRWLTVGEGTAVYSGASCGVVQYPFGPGCRMQTPPASVRTARGKRAELVGIVDPSTGYILPPAVYAAKAAA